jgi:integrative and conjugative element protein (TIGR02256 family)
MLMLSLPPEVIRTITLALRKAGKREIGGVLMAEHIGPNKFVVRDLTVHRRGAIASFVRRIEDTLGRLRMFFERTNHDYTRFNYIGEWHSHPCFLAEPGETDHASMRQIIEDAKVGAHFVVLLVVKLNPGGQLVGSAHTYLPDGTISRSVVQFAN